MSEPSNGAWPFQEIPEEEGLDISAIFGDSSAAPQGDPFAPPAAAQSVPSSPTPVAQEITPAVAATSQPTTAPIAKAPVEAPAENPIAAAFEQKTAENTKKGLLEKPPVFYHKGVKEEIDDPSMTFEELRIRKSDDFTDLEEGKRVLLSISCWGQQTPFTNSHSISPEIMSFWNFACRRITTSRSILQIRWWICFVTANAASGE